MPLSQNKKYLHQITLIKSPYEIAKCFASAVLRLHDNLVNSTASTCGCMLSLSSESYSNGQ